MADIAAYVQNPGSDDWDKVQISSGQLTKNRDPEVPDSGWIETPNDYPIGELAGIVLKRTGGTVFRGYANELTVNPISGNQRVSFISDVEQLNWRLCACHIYERAYHCFIHPFDSAAPSASADTYGVSKNIGLLWMARSLILPTEWTEDPANPGHHIWYLDEAGTRSQFYDKPVYVYGNLLAERTSKANLVANNGSYYYEDNKLWIHIDDYPEEWRAMVFVDGYMETNILKGNIDHPEIELSGNFRVEPSWRILETILTFAQLNFRYASWRTESDATYLDVRTFDGRGQDTGIFEIKNDDIIDLEWAFGKEMPITGLLGTGEGSPGYSQQYHARQNFWPKKVRHFHDVLDISGGYADSGSYMRNLVYEEFTRRRKTKSQTITTMRDGWCRPGDWLKIPYRGGTEISQVEALEMAFVGDKIKDKYQFDMRRPVMREALFSRDRLGAAWLEDYVVETNKQSGSGDIRIRDATHACAGYGLTINFPVTVTEEGMNHRILLDVSFSNPTDWQIITPIRAKLIIYVDSAMGTYLYMPNYILMDAVSNIDITDYITYGSDNTVSVFVERYGNYEDAHSDCTGHPTITVNASARSVTRKRLPADVAL